jgi:hypothetical protein
LTDIGPVAKLEALAHTLKGSVAVEACDVTQRDAVESLVRRHKPFTALADTAGICPFEPELAAAGTISAQTGPGRTYAALESCSISAVRHWE